MALTLQEQFGQIDIYVFDQILRGNITARMRVLDAGCGYGRNLVYLLREGCEIFAVDANPEGVDYVRSLSASLGTGLPADHFQVAALELLPFPDAFTDVVICNSVLHFARDDRHFHAMLQEIVASAQAGRVILLPAGFANRHGV